MFVEKYENNEKAGQATLFDADGNLIYSVAGQNGKRQGHGTAFIDKNGNVVYTGEWKDDRYENGILYRHVQNEDKSVMDRVELHDVEYGDCTVLVGQTGRF